MSKKYYESMRKQDISYAKQVLRQAKRFREMQPYHADLMQVVRLHIDAVRYANNTLKAFN